jgi:hypothetical protein
MNLTANKSEARLPNVKRTPRLIGKGCERFPEPTIFIEEIHIRAETITPVLKGIPGFRPPPRWRINE